MHTLSLGVLESHVRHSSHMHSAVRYAKPSGNRFTARKPSAYSERSDIRRRCVTGVGVRGDSISFLLKFGSFEALGVFGGAERE